MIRSMKIWDGEMPLGSADPEHKNEHENEMVAYLQNDGKIHPAMVIFPGGAYTHYGSAEQAPIAEFYYEHGFNAFIVYYRVAPNRHPAPLLDAQRAIKTVRYHAGEWNVDPARIYTIGFSAGGHLNACVACLPDICTEIGDDIDAMDARPTGAILGYPVISSELGVGHVWSFQQLLGENYEANKAELSMEKKVSADTCPCFLWSTMEDDAVPMENALRFTLALQKAGKSAELHIFPHGVHGIGRAEDVPGLCLWPELTLRWIEELG